MPIVPHAVARVKVGEGYEQDSSHIPSIFTAEIDGRGFGDTGGDHHVAHLSERGLSLVLSGDPMIYGGCGGRCPTVNLRRAIELRDWTTEILMKDADLAEWLLMRRKERFTPILKDALGVMLSPEISVKETAARAQDSSRGRDWTRGD
jgi:hypothetical protein